MDNTQREELARDIFLADNSNASEMVMRAEWEDSDLTTPTAYAYGIADGLIAKGYRKPCTISTVEELDALPDGAVIVDGGKNAHRALKRTDGTSWWNAALTYADSTVIALPATLLGVVAND